MQTVQMTLDEALVAEVDAARSYRRPGSPFHSNRSVRTPGREEIGS